MANTCMVKLFLTGRRRYRLSTEWRAGNRECCMILQVEKSIWRDHKWVCEWSDATPEDVNKEELE